MKTYEEILAEKSENFQRGFEFAKRHMNDTEKNYEIMARARQTVRDEAGKMGKAFFLGEKFDTSELEEAMGMCEVFFVPKKEI
jgi:hypothetical protein